MGGKKQRCSPCSRPTSCPGRLTSSRQTLAAINLVHLNLPSPLLPCYNLRSYQLRPATYSCVYWKLWFHQNPLLLFCVFSVHAPTVFCLKICICLLYFISLFYILPFGKPLTSPQEFFSIVTPCPLVEGSLSVSLLQLFYGLVKQAE